MRYREKCESASKQSTVAYLSVQQQYLVEVEAMKGPGSFGADLVVMALL